MAAFPSHEWLRIRVKGTFRSIDRCSVGEILELESSLAVSRRLFGKVKENGYQIVVRAVWQGMTDSQCHIRWSQQLGRFHLCLFLRGKCLQGSCERWMINVPSFSTCPRVSGVPFSGTRVIALPQPLQNHSVSVSITITHLFSNHTLFTPTSFI